MDLNLVGEPGVSAFLRSVLQNLHGINRMKPTYTTSLYGNHKKDLEKLEDKLVLFQGLVVDGEAKRLDDAGVDKWMDDIYELLYDVDDIFDDIKSLWKDQVSVDYSLLEIFSNCINSQFKKILARAKKLGKKAKELELKRSKSESKQPSIILYMRATSSTVDTSEAVHGREEDKDVIVKRLLEVDDKGKNYDVVGIWGMGGLGKTTLARQVYNDPVLANQFQVRRWVCISDVFDVVRAFKGLIRDDRAGGDDSLETLHERLKKIVENKRFLFVLDDVWPSTDWNMKWDMLKVPFNSCQNGSKILVTTRDSNIAQALGDAKPYPLKGLLHVQCISLFKDKAFGKGDVDEGEIEKLMVWGEKIVRACKGVPLAVKVTGSMLQRSKEEKWRAVSEKANLWDMTDIKGGIHPAIRLSYHYLPASLKRCFEYLAVFPPDFKFDQNDVVCLWIADGLVQDVDGSLAEDIGEEYYNELKARSLIQENDMMHDIVHHLASIVCKKFYYKENSKELPASVRHAFLVKLNDMHCEFLAQASCLRTLIVIDYDNANLVSNAIKSCKMLRTLKIGPYEYHRPTYSLEESFVDQLSHIRYLFIHNSHIRHLPDSLCMLSNLQFLYLRGSSYHENLLDRIHQLSNLRILNVSFSKILSLPDSICALSQLQVLNLFFCEGLKQLPKDIGKLRSLRILDLCKTSISSLPESICALSQLQALNLNGCRRLKHLPEDIGNLRSLCKLYLSETSILSVPESILNAIGLQQLIVDENEPLTLHIGSIARLEELPIYPLG